MSLAFSTFRGGRLSYIRNFRNFGVYIYIYIYRLIFPSKSNLFAEPGGLELLSPGRAVLNAGWVSGGRFSAAEPVQCDNSRGSRDGQSGEQAWRPADSEQGYREGAIHSRLWTE